ncbi:MAG: zinc-ribbon domain-containing protein [Gemmataceae bacterium]|nr:zinc-ribbon domain-containing protein [Gemmataceae bacterium]
MPFSVKCPNCAILLQLPDNAANKKVKCSQCQTVFQAGAGPTPVAPGGYQSAPAPMPTTPPPPPPRDDDDDMDFEDRRRRRYEEETSPLQLSAEEVQSWQSVATGFRLHALAHFLYAGGLGIFLLFFLLSLATGGRGGGIEVLGVILTMTGGFLLFGNLILALISSCYFLPANARYGAKALGISCLVLVVLVLLRMTDSIGTVFMFLDRMGGGAPGLFYGSFFAAGLLELCRLTLLPLFMRAAGYNMRNGALATNGLILAIVTPAATVLLTLLTFLMGAVSRGPGAIVVVMLFLSLGTYIGLLIWGALIMLTAGRVVNTRAQ